MAKIIDMFTRKEQEQYPLDEVPTVTDVMKEFSEMAKHGPENLDPAEQEWFCDIFRDTYLNGLLEAVRGIEESAEVEDLEHFIKVALKEVEGWPKVGRA
jgi:hypothetical protein